ncbi:MAG: hypothetical protein EXS39_05315 [Opitutaceae bacterium]|nr:hypothetical protein [Opitutaceae bacterium]
MKLRPASFLLAALAALGPAAGLLVAEAQKDPKIQLMEEGFAARDKGDFIDAKHRFEALLAIVPNDPGVRRLIADMDARQAAEQAGLLAQQEAAAAAAVAPPPLPPAQLAVAAEVHHDMPLAVAPALRLAPAAIVALPAPAHPEPASATLMTVPVITEGKPPPPPASTLPEGYAVALAKVEAEGVAFARTEGADRLEKLMTYVQAQRALARLYARDGNYPLAMSTLDAALASIKTSTNELRAEREEFARQEEIKKQGVRVRHRR